MKKILTMITALCCVSSMMAVLPAHAEELQTRVYNEYMIIGTQENENSSAPDYILHYAAAEYDEEAGEYINDDALYILSGEDVENIRIVGADSWEEFEYGQMLYIEGGNHMTDSSHHIHLTETNYLYPAEVPCYSKLTLTGSADYDGYTEFTLENNEGKNYTYKQWDNITTPINLNDCQNGDIIAFIADSSQGVGYVPLKQLNAPKVPNLEGEESGIYAVVKSVSYNPASSYSLRVTLLDEEHLGQNYKIDFPEKIGNGYPMSADVYHTDVYLKENDLIYINFSGEFEQVNESYSEMHCTAEDSIEWCGNAFDYLETTPYVATKYIKEKMVYEYTNSVTGTTIEEREYSPYMSLNDSVIYLTYHDVPLYPIEWVENPKKYSLQELASSLQPFYLVLDGGITVQKIGHKIPDTPEWQEYKEYFQVPDYKFKQRDCEVLQINDGLNGQLDGQEYPKTGDLLRINSTGGIAEIYPGCIHFNKEDTIENLGNITEIATLKDLTVADAETNTVTLKDADGEIYYYQKGDLRFYDEFGSAYTTFNPKAGETITFYMYENEPVLPKLDSDLTVIPVPTVTATGDADGSGELDILDIITVNKAILGKENLSEDRISYVDFNGNGVPDADDALTMLKMLVGLI